MGGLEPGVKMMDLFDDDLEFTGPSLDASRIRAAEAILGFRLPSSYAGILLEQNGGSLRHRCCFTSFPTSWADDHFSVNALLGHGGEWGMDTEFGSAYLIEEWGYPRIGLVIGVTPSAGHDTVMLDYSACGPDGEPTVVYVDEDRVPKKVADSFDAFLAMLRPCPEYDATDESLP